jgi:hypothetical protein
LSPGRTHEDAVGRAPVDDEHLAVDAANFRVRLGYRTGTVLDADGPKSAPDGIRSVWGAADQAVSIDVEAGIVVE